jgi:hypothetical protein
VFHSSPFEGSDAPRLVHTSTHGDLYRTPRAGIKVQTREKFAICEAGCLGLRATAPYAALARLRATFVDSEIYSWLRRWNFVP